MPTSDYVTAQAGSGHGLFLVVVYSALFVAKVSNPGDYIRLSVRKVGETSQEPPGFCESHLAKQLRTWSQT